MPEKVTLMKLNVDLQCSSCYKKVKKILCKFPQIRDQVYDEQQNLVKITVVCCSPEKIRDKLCCKGGKVIKSIEIVEPPPPKPKQPEKPKEPEKKPKEPEKKPEVVVVEKPKEPEKPKPPPGKPKEAPKSDPPKKPKPDPAPPPRKHLNQCPSQLEHTRTRQFQLGTAVTHVRKVMVGAHATTDMGGPYHHHHAMIITVMVTGTSTGTGTVMGKDVTLAAAIISMKKTLEAAQLCEE